MNAKFYELHNLIQKTFEEDSWTHLGLRSVHSEEECKIGEYLDNSSIWEDDVPTDYQLNGTCSIGFCERSYSEKQLIEVIQKHGQTWCDYFGVENKPTKFGYTRPGYGDINLVLIQGESAERGEDDGEHIIENAKVIWVAK